MPSDLDPYRSLVPSATAWWAGPDGERTWVEPSWLGVAGDGWLDGVHPDDREPCRVILREARETGRGFTHRYRLRRPDGSYRSVSERGVPVAPSGCFVGTATDLDPRDAGTRYVGVAELFEMSLDNLCIARLDGYFEWVNPSWTRSLGWTREELLSQPSASFVHPDDRAATLAGRQRLREGGHLERFTNRYRCKDGSYRWFEWRSIADVERGLVYGAARDVTERMLDAERLRDAAELQEKLQRQLLFADRMASVGTLAAGVAHEINNPLSSVTANIALILEELARLNIGPIAELKEMSVAVGAGAERIQKIVRGLATFSRVEEERRRVIELQPALDLAVDMTLNEIRARARLVKTFGPTPPVDADESRLSQVFIHLLMNAAQAIPEGASAHNEIRLTTSTDPAGRAVIEVGDTGTGIPAHLVDRVFDPFFTTRPVGTGTGLGLSICHNLVTAVGGEITVRSEPGRGATFRVVLPPALATNTATAAGGSHRGAARGSVLVVDDEIAVGTVLRRILRHHDVTVVTTARAALEHLESGRSFHVILSDLMMSGMSGMELHDHLVREFPAVAGRMVFVSGGAFTPAAHAFLDRVPNERIWKPFDPQDIRDIVQRFVDVPSD